MSKVALDIVEQFNKLPLPERRELVQVLSTAVEVSAAATPPRRKSLDEVVGKFEPLPEPEVKDHNYWFAEAILASKRGAGEA